MTRILDRHFIFISSLTFVCSFAFGQEQSPSLQARSQTSPRAALPGSMPALEKTEQAVPPQLAPVTAVAATAQLPAAVKPPVRPRTLLGPAPPYAPRKTDYSLELGWMRVHEDLLWLGGSFGFHLGNCLFSDSETCQQYLDFIGGAAVREGETYGVFLGSVRWQYVNFPDRYSPFWRLYGGAASVSRSTERGWRTAFGAGLGVTNYLHEKIDLRFETRVGMIDRSYAQVLIGFQVKADDLLTTFARKLRDFGYGTVKTAIQATGTAIQATGEGLEGIVDGVSSQFRDEDKAPQPAPQPEDKPATESTIPP